MKFKRKDKEGVFKSLFAAYFVLLLHVFLLAGTGITVVLFRGVYHYLPWIMGGLALLILALFWFFYLRLKKGTRDMRDILAFPEFRDRNVEIKLLGGFASIKIDGKNDSSPMIGYDETSSQPKLLQLDTGQETVDARLRELARLYQDELITREEYDAAKQKILYE